MLSLSYPLGINVSRASVIIESKLTWPEQWEGDPATVGGEITTIWATSDLLDYISTNYCIDTSRMLAAGFFQRWRGFVGTLACDQHFSTRFSTFAANSGARVHQHDRPAILHPSSQSTITQSVTRRVDPTSPCSSSMAMQTARSHIWWTRRGVSASSTALGH